MSREGGQRSGRPRTADVKTGVETIRAGVVSGDQVAEDAVGLGDGKIRLDEILGSRMGRGAGVSHVDRPVVGLGVFEQLAEVVERGRRLRERRE